MGESSRSTERTERVRASEVKTEYFFVDRSLRQTVVNEADVPGSCGFSAAQLRELDYDVLWLLRWRREH